MSLGTRLGICGEEKGITKVVCSQLMRNSNNVSTAQDVKFTRFC